MYFFRFARALRELPWPRSFARAWTAASSATSRRFTITSTTLASRPKRKTKRKTYFSKTFQRLSNIWSTENWLKTTFYRLSLECQRLQPIPTLLHLRSPLRPLSHAGLTRRPPPSGKKTNGLGTFLHKELWRDLEMMTFKWKGSHILVILTI